MAECCCPQTAASPVQHLLALSLGVAQTQVLRLAVELRIPDLLDTPRSLTELAAATRTQPGALACVMNVLTELQLVRETTAQTYECTEIGTGLRSDAPNSVHLYPVLMGQQCFSRAWSELHHSVATGRSAFEKEIGSDVYRYFKEHPAVGAVMNQAMSELSNLEGPAIRDVYDCASYRRIVDVAGGRGGLLSVLLAASPQSRGVLFDQEHVVADAVPSLAAAGVAERCEIVAGDFLTEVPAGGDLYLLKRVLIDRPDDEALVLLRNIRRAMEPHGRVLVADPHTGTRYGRYLDLFMLLVFGSHLRTESELGTLLEKAGFVLTQVIDTDSAIRLIEAAPAGPDH